MNVARILTYATIALLAGAATCFAGDPWANTVRVEATAGDGTVHYGMGLVSDAEGHVLTAAAVVLGAGPVRLTAADGSTTTAEVLGSDPDSFLAVLKAPDLAGKQPPQVAATAPAAGSEVNVLGGGVTKMLVGGWGRPSGRPSPESFLVLDGILGEGDLGAGVYDGAGSLVALVSAQTTPATGSTGATLALPAARAIQLGQSIVTQGSVSRNWIGVHVQRLTPQSMQDYKIPLHRDGVVILGIFAKSPAEAAGLKVGDLITMVGERRIGEVDQLREVLADHPFGAPLKIAYLREDKRGTVELKPVAKPASVELLPEEQQKITYDEKDELQAVKDALFAFGDKTTFDFSAYRQADQARQAEMIKAFFADYPAGTMETMISRHRYAERYFSNALRPGVSTDKGKVYLKYGKPDYVTVSQYSTTQVPAIRSPNEIDTWYYYDRGIAYQFNVLNNYIYDLELRSIVRLSEAAAKEGLPQEF